MSYMYKIPKDINENRMCLLGKIKLSGNRMCLISLIMSIAIIMAHMSNSVPSFFEAINITLPLFPLSLFVLIPVYIIYWVGLVIFPFGFIITTYNIITEYRFRGKNRKSYFIKRK